MFQVDGNCLFILPNINIEPRQIDTTLNFILDLGNYLTYLFDSFLLGRIDYLNALLDLLSVHGFQAEL